MRRRALMALAISLFLVGDAVAAAPTQADAKPSFVYVGTYEGGGGRGIYLFERVGAGLAWKPLGAAAELPNASFLAVDAQRRLLFAVNESRAGGGVNAFSFDPTTGKLTALNRQSSQGAGPCHLAIAPGSSHVVVANYGSGSVAVLPIDDDGSLGEATDIEQHVGNGPNAGRQEGPHAHCVTFSPDGGRVYVCDLGIDKVMIYKLDAEAGTLTANEPPYAELAPGAGPRHMVFGRDGRFAYVLNELDGTLTTFAHNANTGALTAVDTTSTLPPGFAGENTNAELVVHPYMSTLYTSNRGSDTIAVFAITDAGVPVRRQIVPTAGRTPRHFAIGPEAVSVFVANQSSGTITELNIDIDTGDLSEHLTGIVEPIRVPSPACLMFVGASDGQ